MPLNKEEIIEVERAHSANVYHKRDLVITKGKGALVWDITGKKFIDCMAGYGTCLVGHSHPKVVEAIRNQAERLSSCHSSFYNDARSELILRVSKIAPRGLSRVFLCNSGAESVECAIKTARKFTGKHEIIAMMRGFHGKTIGALSATWEAKYRSPFEPLLPRVRFVPYGKIDKVRDLANADTAAILVEPIQGEGGVNPAPQGYLKQLRELTEEKGILLILDEIQTGWGRTGKLFACEHWDVNPDVMCLAKAGASGIPFGITLAKDDIMSALKVGEHSSTFGGNPISCAAASATIDVIEEEKIPQKASDLGDYFRDALLRLAERHSIIREIRGLGLMIGVEMRFDVLKILNAMLDNGVIILDAGVNVLRFLPPAALTREQIDEISAKLGSVLAKYRVS